MSARCPVCSLGNNTSVEKLQGYSMLHCHDCDLVFAEPMHTPPEFYVDNPDYILRDELLTDPLEEDRRWDMRMFLSSPHSGGSLLDIGCGTGFLVSRAAALGYDAHGIEFNKRAVERGRGHFGLQTIYSLDLKGLKLEKPGLKFDIVTMFQVLEHLEQPNSILEDLKPMLNRGGRLVLALPFRERWPDVLGDVDMPPHHLSRWSRKALEKFLFFNGFRVTRFEVEPFPPDGLLGIFYRFALKLVPSLTMKGQGVHHKAKDMGLDETRKILRLRRLKVAAANAIGLPVWLALKLLGARGPNCYVEAVFSDKG